MAVRHGKATIPSHHAGLGAGVPVSQAVQCGVVATGEPVKYSAADIGANAAAAELFERNAAAVADVDEYRAAHASIDLASPADSSPAKLGKTFRFFNVEEFGDLPPMDWLLKDLLPRRGLGQLFGASGAGKSFVALDLVWHLAEGRDWFGWKYKRHNSQELPHIFYLCLEGAEGFRLRVLGIKSRWYDPMGRPFPNNLHFCFDDFQLFEASEVAALVEAINAKKGGVPPVVVIDTQAQATPAISVNDPEAMKRVVSAAGELQRAVDGFVLLVAHAGKNTDPDKGAMGSVEQKNPCDTQIAVLKNGNGETRTVKAVKVKDGIDGIMCDFSLSSVLLGHDEDGDPITTCTVDPLGNKAKAKGDKLTQPNLFALDCFKEARGASIRPVTDEEWREVFFLRSTYSNNDSKRSAFNRAKAALQEKGLLLCHANTYTLSTDAENTPPC